MECYCFRFPDWWLFGRSKWPQVCPWFCGGLWYSFGCVRGCRRLGFQDYERQHTSAAPSLAGKHATTTVIIFAPCFRLEHLNRSSLSSIHTHSRLPLIASVLLPCYTPPQLYWLSWLDIFDISVAHSSNPSLRPTTRSNLSAKYVARRCLHMRLDSVDKTDSVKAGQSQKYLFTPESVQAGR